uniref:Conserved plasma membrane protein n=1 Tax=Steinernema glaseri TaxID=37863 RepID=A0A1I7Z1P3_9BILA
MVSLRLSCVGLLAVLFLADFGFAAPALARSESFTFEYLDRSIKGNTRKVKTHGMFRYYSTVKEAIDLIEKGGANWCGFGEILQKRHDIMKFWSDKEVKDFIARMKKSDCNKQYARGIFSRSDQNDQEEGTEYVLLPYNVTLGLAIVFGCFTVIMILLVIALCIMCCKNSSGKLPFYNDRRDPTPPLQRSNRSASQRADSESSKSGRDSEF